VRALRSASAAGVRIVVYLVDDASTDGTAQEARTLGGIEIHVVDGSGDLYWNSAMRIGWDLAVKDNPDFYLWLNDDLVLRNGAIDNLLATYRANELQYSGNLIVVGRSHSPKTGEVSYGGYRRAPGFSRISWRRLEHNERTCDTMNGNCVLLPARAYNDIGNLSAKYRHSFGDIDYGLRARRSGYAIIESRESVGYQQNNFQIYSGARLPLTKENLRFVFFHPKGVPLNEWWYFCRTHAGWLWPINFILRYVKMFVGHQKRAIRSA